MKAGWEIKKLGEVLEKTETIDPLRTPDRTFSYIDVSSVDNELLKVTETQTLLGKDAPSRARRLVRKDDVLFATIRPTLRRIALVPVELDGQVCSTGYFVLRPKAQLDSRYCFYFLQTETYLLAMEALQKGASYPAVTDGDVRSQPIPIPPLSEQAHIVGILDEAFASIATAKANTQKNLENTKAVFESYLNSVFSNRGDGWVEKKLGEVCHKIGSGATPLGGETAYKQSGISLIRSLNVHDLEFKYKDLAFIDEDQAARLSNVKVEKDDVLLNITGASVARCCTVPSDVLPARVNQHVSIIRPATHELSPFFLHYLLISRPFKSNLHQVGEDGGSTRQAITKAQIQEFRVTYPSRDQQDRIVASINTLSEETFRLTSLYTQKLSALEDLKKSLLHQAFTGKL